MFNKGYSEVYDLFNRSKPYKKEIEFVWNWTHQPKKILDLGCGTANYWKYYPRGVEICGIEQSEEMVSRSKFKDKIYCGDITNIDPFTFRSKFDAATALFDVVNYVDQNKWWKYLPLVAGGYFVFDIWNKEKVVNDGFRISIKIVNGTARIIQPIYQDETKVRLQVTVTSSTIHTNEIHEMYLYSTADVMEFAGEEFEIADIKTTESWQQWFKLKRK